MPSLSWRGKNLPQVQPATLMQDSITFPGGRGYPSQPARGRLILGDNLKVMSALVREYESRVDLIYADPPFFTNRSYSARVGRGEDSRKPEDWALAEGYVDHWPDLDAYLEFLYPRLALMHRLLSPRGSLYLHLDWHANSYARLLLDEIFGEANLLNEVVWTYHGPSPVRRAFNRKHDTILVYVKSGQFKFNAEAVREPYHPSTIQTFKASPKAGFGKVPDLDRGKVPEDWWYFPVVARLHRERTGYPTQKPEALLERIIRASSDPGDTVADFFCGSGTAAVVASRLGRGFIAGDNAFRAVHTTRRRLCALQAEPFSIEYEASSEGPRATAAKRAVTSADGAIRLSNTEGLDYWEVDPDWDGRVFRSAAQAQLPYGNGEVPDALQTEAGGRACIRLVTVEGAVMQQELDV